MTPGRVGQQGSGAQRACYVGLLLLVILGLELTSRWLIPIPDLLGMDRADHFPRSARRLGVLSYATKWWVSSVDSAFQARRMNVYGYHDRRDWKTEAGTDRVAFIGDSFVEGLGMTDGYSTIPRLFESYARTAGDAVESLNLGMAGAGIPEYWSVIRTLVPQSDVEDVVVVLYVNDLYAADPILADSPASDVRVLECPLLTPRLVCAIVAVRAGGLVPMRYRRWVPPGSPRPFEVAHMFDLHPELSRLVERATAPEIATQMKSGWLNPAVANHLARTERQLRESNDWSAVLARFEEFVSCRGRRLGLVYLPSLNQVSDRYLSAQVKLSLLARPASLMGSAYQQQARDLARATTEVGVPFLDLTKSLVAGEVAHGPLYWAYDGHMTNAGYDVSAAAIRSWWEQWPRARGLSADCDGFPRDAG